MATRLATGFITISDVVDGSTPVYMFLSNENHSFVADQNGDVLTEERTSFSSLLNVFVGGTAGTPKASAVNGSDPVGSFYATVSATNSWGVSYNATTGVLTVTSIPAGLTAASKSSSVTVSVSVVNNNSQVITGELVISLQKLVEGVDGVAIRLLPDRTYFTFDENAFPSSPSDSASVDINVTGNVGSSLSYTIKGYSSSGSTTLATGSISDLTDTSPEDGILDNGTITIPVSRFCTGNNAANSAIYDAVSLEVVGSGGSIARDIVTFARVDQGQTGTSALRVEVLSSAGTVFKNGAADTTTKTLICKVYDEGTGNEVTSGVTYLWSFVKKSGTAGTVKIDNTTNRNVQTTGVDATTQTIVVDQADVDDGEYTQYTCTVSVTS